MQIEQSIASGLVQLGNGNLWVAGVVLDQLQGGSERGRQADMFPRDVYGYKFA
jgi:hypothetical protein